MVGRPGAGDSAGDGRLFCSYRRIFSEFLHRFHAFFFLVHNLLLLNEFPDAQADVTVGRRTLPIIAGKKKAAYFFSFVTLLVYVWVVWAVIYDHMPVFTLLSLLTLPLGFQVIKGSFGYDDRGTFLKAMGQNVLLVLVTQALIAAGYILSGIFLK